MLRRPRVPLIWRILLFVEKARQRQMLPGRQGLVNTKQFKDVSSMRISTPSFKIHLNSGHEANCY